MSLSLRCNGKSGSVPDRMEIKLFLKVRMCCSSVFLLWFFFVELVAIVFDFCPSRLGGVCMPHCLVFVVLAWNLSFWGAGWFLIRLHDWFLGSIWKRFDENSIWVICIYDHHIFVSAAWLDRKSSGLVGVYLPCGHLWLVDGCVDIDELIFCCFECWLLSKLRVFPCLILIPQCCGYWIW